MNKTLEIQFLKRYFVILHETLDEKPCYLR